MAEGKKSEEYRKMTIGDIQDLIAQHREEIKAIMESGTAGGTERIQYLREQIDMLLEILEEKMKAEEEMQIPTTKEQLDALRTLILTRQTILHNLREAQAAKLGDYTAAIAEMETLLANNIRLLLRGIEEYSRRNEPLPGFPKYGEPIIRVGENLTINWNLRDIEAISFYLLKGNTKTLLAKQEITGSREFDGQGKNAVLTGHIIATGSKVIPIDQNFHSTEYLPCKVRIEMDDDPTVFTETLPFKVLKSN